LKDTKKIEDVLFEVRPYVQYWERLRNLVLRLWEEAEDEENFLQLLNEELQRAEEPFKTDLKIFLQKFESLKG
jgi:hypothetical protein